jgi:hypothetical protein
METIIDEITAMLAHLEVDDAADVLASSLAAYLREREQTLDDTLDEAEIARLLERFASGVTGQRS